MIPFNQPFTGSAELAAIDDALNSGHLCGAGPVSRRVEALMSQLFGASHVLLTSSCTHTMELALMVLEIKPGDEVICPSFTFVSTATAIVQQGARPVFTDICPDTLNIDPDDVARRVTPHTRVIMVVHYAGIACDMEAIAEIARRHELLVVEDAAHGVGARYRGRCLGTLGDIGCYSFHGTKNVTCGEGGAFLTANAELALRAEVGREKGTDRARFLRGEVDRYTWQAAGSSYVLSDLLAAMLETQLHKLDEITARRRSIFDRYWRGLAPLQEMGALRLPTVPESCEHNGHIFFVLFESESLLDHCLAGLRAAGIGAAFHFQPLHTSPFGRQFSDGPLPVTERAARTLLRLPIYPAMTDSQVDSVVDTLRQLVATASFPCSSLAAS